MCNNNITIGLTYRTGIWRELCCNNNITCPKPSIFNSITVFASERQPHLHTHISLLQLKSERKKNTLKCPHLTQKILISIFRYVLELFYWFSQISFYYTVCPRSSDRFDIVSYYIKLVTTSWTNSIYATFYRI